jgi:hypothetical protein
MLSVHRHFRDSGQGEAGAAGHGDFRKREVTGHRVICCLSDFQDFGLRSAVEKEAMIGKPAYPRRAHDAWFDVLVVGEIVVVT